MKKIWLFLLWFILCLNFTKAGYTEEFPEAYTWAYSYSITTQPTIETANMYWEITRIELSKMISNYAINVLNKQVDTSKKCEFDDISEKLNKQYDLWVIKSCQLWLMWQWITDFRPNDKVTRAEFWTILSRLLYWDKYNWWNPYYKEHVNQLNLKWIMTNISNLEKWKEIRGNVMVMLKRSEKLWNLEIPSFEELKDVVTQCEYEDDFDGEMYLEDITKQELLLPYKDWYIWYDYWGQEWWSIYLTYKDKNHPCETLSQSDTILWYGAYIEDEDHPLTNVYTSIWNWDSWRTEEVVKKLNCKPDYNYIEWSDCEKELNRYIYNLIVWKEEQEYFTQRMNKFKQDIDNNKFTNYSFRQKRRIDCNDKVNKELDQLKGWLNWRELENLRLQKEHECAIEYLKK